MKKRSTRTFLPLVLASAAIALLFVQRPLATSAIVNGIETGGRLANVGMLVGRFAPEGEWHWLQCTGTLVGANVFVTAAHCIALAPPVVEFGVAFTPSIPIDQANALNPPMPTDVRVYRGDAYHHPAFAPENLTSPDLDSFDVGVVVLHESPKGKPNAQIVPAGYFDRVDGASQHSSIGLAGYGLTSFLPWLGLQPIDWGTRRVTIGQLQNVYPGKIIVAPAPGQICGGDSGGPAFPVRFDALDHPIPPYVIRVSAVASFTVLTDTALPCETASIFYRLDTPQARSFLGNFVRLRDAE